MMKRTMRAALVLGASLTCVPAVAADLVLKAPAPAATWTGFYAGLSVGARWAHAEATLSAVAGGAPAAVNNPTTYESQSPRAGVYAGYNWQVSNRFVIGVEADWAWAKAGSVHAWVPGVAVTAGDQTECNNWWDAGIRGRAGVLLNPNVLLYGTAGAGWVHVKTTATLAAFGTQAIEANRFGWTAGGGAEMMLTRNLLGRVEYRYFQSNWSSVYFNTATVDYRANTHTALIGLAYKL